MRKGKLGKEGEGRKATGSKFTKGEAGVELGQFAAFSRPRPEECQQQPEQPGLCQSLHSALLSNGETGSLE